MKQSLHLQKQERIMAFEINLIQYIQSCWCYSAYIRVFQHEAAAWISENEKKK